MSMCHPPEVPMLRLSKCSLLLLLIMASTVALGASGGSTFAQGMPGLPGGLLPPMQQLWGAPFRVAEEDMPGLTNPGNPFVFLPVFQGELRARLLGVFLSGTVKNLQTGQTVDIGDGFEIVRSMMTVETMARAQIGRLSLRIHYDHDISGFKGSGARLDWPLWQFGFDLDLVNTPCLRLGLNMDWFPWYPTMTLISTPLGSIKMTPDQQAVTAGVHAVYSPRTMWGMAPTAETKGYISLTPRAARNEVEVAAGLKGPATMLGSMAVRGGCRFTWFKITDPLGFEVNGTWSAFFGDVVYYY